jgi:predicted amidohydrolase
VRLSVVNRTIRETANFPARFNFGIVDGWAELVLPASKEKDRCSGCPHREAEAEGAGIVAFIVAAAQSASEAGDTRANVARHLRFAQAAADRGVGLLVFPELSLTGYEPALARASVLDPHDTILLPLASQAAESRMAIVVGAPLAGPEGQLYIGAVALLPDLSCSVYAKQHLHPSEEQVLEAGPGGDHLQVRGKRVALAICADTGQATHAAAAAAKGAHLYAAGVLFTSRGYGEDAATLAGYACQHRMTVVMANHATPTGGYTPAGRSAVWAPGGALVAAAETGEALVIAASADDRWIGAVVAL